MCDRFPWKFDVQASYKLASYVLRLIFVVNIKFPWATYHTIVPSTEELLLFKWCTEYAMQANLALLPGKKDSFH